MCSESSVGGLALRPECERTRPEHDGVAGRGHLLQDAGRGHREASELLRAAGLFLPEDFAALDTQTAAKV